MVTDTVKVMTVIGVIPARFASTRLPAKPLADIHGKPMIQWVYEQAKKSRLLNEVIVATDDERIVSAIERAGGKAMMTDPNLASGTDRVAAVAEKTKGDIFVNIQGDEPLMSEKAIDASIELIRSGGFQMASVMTPIRARESFDNLSVVKVLVDSNDRAIYFSRFPIPYTRETPPTDPARAICRQHVGLYAYTRETLFRFRSLSPTLLEKAESLEQLRALHNGIAIGMAEVDFESIGVDTPEDLEKVRQILWQSRKNTSS